MIACAVDNGIGEPSPCGWPIISLSVLSRPVGRTEPDLDLIKQVEQVTRFGRIPGIWMTGAVGVRVFREFAIYPFAVICLQKTATTAAGAEAHLFAKGSPAMLLARPAVAPGHMGCRAVALPNSVRKPG